jgi:hypothetical protein
MDAAEPSAVFVVAPHEQPAIEIRINFGIYAGRDVTSVEIDHLAEQLLDKVDGVTIVAEERHEIGHGRESTLVEASVHQVKIEVDALRAPTDAKARREIEIQLLERADYWLRLCVADRHGDTAEL